LTIREVVDLGLNVFERAIADNQAWLEQVNNPSNEPLYGHTVVEDGKPGLGLPGRVIVDGEEVYEEGESLAAGGSD
jgi:hypothetical protein